MKYVNDDEFPEMNVLDRHPERYKIDAESEFVVWEIIMLRIFELFKKKNKENYAGFNDDELHSYTSDVYVWMKETHHIYNFYFNKLDDLVQFVDEHIFDPMWRDDILEKIKLIWGVK